MHLCSLYSSVTQIAVQDLKCLQLQAEHKKKGYDAQICLTEVVAKAKGTALWQRKLSYMLVLYSRINSLKNQAAIKIS